MASKEHRGLGFDRNQKLMLVSVGFIEIVRAFGIFLILPVFTLYGKEFTNSPLLVGLALGSYGLTMAIFQAPIGILADKFGKKRVIILGMVPFIVGSFISWHPGSIAGLILGRLIAGSGAVTSSGMGMVQENVPPDRRNMAMAILGIPIGFSFMVAVVLGPYIATKIGADFLFLITGILGIVSIFPFMAVKHDGKIIHKTERKSAGRIDVKSMALGGVGFQLSFFSVVLFYYLPIFGTSVYGSNGYEFLLLWPVVIGGIVAVLSSGFADRGKMVLFSLISLAIISISIPFLYFLPISLANRNFFYIGLIIFFTGYSISETVFVPLISKISKKNSYSANIGIYNTIQYSGQFVGSIIAGVVLTLNLSLESAIRVSYILLGIMLFSFLFLYLGTRYMEPLHAMREGESADLPT